MKLSDLKQELVYDESDAIEYNNRIPANSKIGKLTVLNYHGTTKYIPGSRDKKVRYYDCICECGNPEPLIFSYDNLNSVRKGKRHSISCGCNKAVALANFVKENPDRSNWNIKRNKYSKDSGAVSHYRSIRDRCYCKSNKKYHLYGGRGIKLCPEWENSENGIDNFCDWMYDIAGYTDDMGSEVSIDRIDNNKDYSPTNCRLSYNMAQSNNKNQNRDFVWYGERYNLKEIANLFGKKADGTGARINEGKPLYEVLRSPLFTSKYEREEYMSQFPFKQIPHIPFVIEPFHFVDHSEIGLMDRYRIYDKPVSDITMSLTAENYRKQLIENNKPAIKPFQFTNSGSTDFLLEGNTKTYYHVKGIKEDIL